MEIEKGNVKDGDLDSFQSELGGVQMDLSDMNVDREIFGWSDFFFLDLERNLLLIVLVYIV